MKYKVRKDTDVYVISGSNKGKRGKVMMVLKDSQQVVVEGVNMVKKHLKKSQENPNGLILEKEAPIHYSNVIAVEEVEARKKRRDSSNKANNGTA